MGSVLVGNAVATGKNQASPKKARKFFSNIGDFFLFRRNSAPASLAGQGSQRRKEEPSVFDVAEAHRKEGGQKLSSGLVGEAIRSYEKAICSMREALGVSKEPLGILAKLALLYEKVGDLHMDGGNAILAKEYYHELQYLCRNHRSDIEKSAGGPEKETLLSILASVTKKAPLEPAA